MKVLVFDFEVPPGIRETPSAVQGWWLGARNIRQNPRAGKMFAERLNSALAVYPWVNLFSQVDLKYYFSRKTQRLKEAYPHLTDEEVTNLMSQVPQLDFARELGADKLLTGKIITNFLSENRTIHVWSSRADIQVRMVDVLTGKVEWEKEYKLKRSFSSQYTVQDEIAQQVSADMKEEYFRPLTIASTR